MKFDGGRHGSECAVVSEEEQEVVKSRLQRRERGQRTNYREEVSGE
jgi:hypothetical protein